MEDSQKPCLIGVDGGGTSCRVALLIDGRRFEVTLGQANATTSRGAAIATVQSGIDQVVEKAGINADALANCHAHIALAGVMRDEDAREIAAGLTPGQITVSDDRVSTVVGALGACSGCVAGIGTGSFLARQSGAQMQFIGGWGLVLGDEASGAWLGRGLLAATLRAVDGIGPSSGLTDQCLHRYGDAARIVAFASNAAPADFADLARDVVAAAKVKDVIGEMLMQQGGDYIAKGLRHLGWKPGEMVCLTGGVARMYARWLPADIAANIQQAKGTALDGALELAAQEAQVGSQGLVT
jgi:glucosamine kinase